MTWAILVVLALACKVGHDTRSYRRRLMNERLEFERYLDEAGAEREWQ